MAPHIRPQRPAHAFTYAHTHAALVIEAHLPLQQDRLLAQARMCRDGRCRTVHGPHFIPSVSRIGRQRPGSCSSLSPACIRTADSSCGGNVFPRSALRRNIPRQAFALK